MKKIVSVLAVAALSFSVVFAADISLSYKTAGTVYSEENTKDYSSNKAVSQTRTALDQSGYADAQSDIVISASADWAGFVLDFDPNASTKKDMGSDWFDEYYGWLNYGPLQVTTGKWTSRYGYELDDDAGEWEDDDFARYHVGVIKGRYGHDVDNLTQVYTYDTSKDVGEQFKDDAEQRVSTALALTLRPSDGMYLMFKGVAVQNNWGSTLRNGGDKRTYNDYSKDTGGDLFFQSGFAGEFAFHVDNAIDINVVAKSLVRDDFVIGAFIRPLLGDTKLLFGFTYGTDLKDYGKDGAGNAIYDRNYNEFGVDLRARFKLSDSLALTTMHNVSVYNKAKVKDQKYSENNAFMWNMASVAYTASEQLTLQFTLENECTLFHGERDKEHPDDTKYWGPRNLGGYRISIIPGATYQFNENASITAGLKWDIYNIGVLNNFGIKDTDDFKNKTASEFSIPVVFSVSL